MIDLSLVLLEYHSFLRSSVAERAAVNREAVGSTPTVGVGRNERRREVDASAEWVDVSPT